MIFKKIAIHFFEVFGLLSFELWSCGIIVVMSILKIIKRRINERPGNNGVFCKVNRKTKMFKAAENLFCFFEAPYTLMLVRLQTDCFDWNSGIKTAVDQNLLFG